ncbi:MAG: ATP-dependent sacrificial sulfur transferase LarE [candidate division Zixibacteria bacterium]|nr:ATP-dependent sacrificial sulfur transferase LarE [candidate division Zixibacteria bacterium]
MNETIQNKLDVLKAILADMNSVMVAYSGGVDSTLLLKVAADVLGDAVTAVTAISEIHTPEENEHAVRLAETLGVKHITVRTHEINDPAFTANPPDRCYFCKKSRFIRMLEMMRELGIEHLIEGTNVDDEGDYRPGMKAVEELGVRSPLKEAGLTKAEIRIISKELNLPTWDKPASPCLATRIPYGQKITPERLIRVEQAEKFLHTLGIKILRVRDHGELARIEVTPEDMLLVMDKANTDKIAARLKELGFTYVTLDLTGYRSGSMNETLKRDEK